MAWAALSNQLLLAASLQNQLQRSDEATPTTSNNPAASAGNKNRLFNSDTGAENLCLRKHQQQTNVATNSKRVGRPPASATKQPSEKTDKNLMDCVS